MSSQGPLDLYRAVLSPGDLPGLQRLVLVVLVRHRNNGSGRCDPSLNRIAACAGIHRTAVIRALKGLVNAGLVVSDLRNGRPSNYTLNLAELVNPPGSGERPVAESDRLRRPTVPVAESARTSSGERPELMRNCEGTPRRGAHPQFDPEPAAKPGPAPEPAGGLAEIPVRQPGRGTPTPTTWWLTERTRAEIAAEYPGLDVVEVAKDLARKVRAGARDPYTYRGMRKGLASWVAQEAESGGNRSRPVKHAARVDGRDWDGEAEARRDRVRVEGEAVLAAAGLTPEEYAAGVDFEN